MNIRPQQYQISPLLFFFILCEGTIKDNFCTASVAIQYGFFMTQIHETDDQVSINYTPLSSNVFWIFCCHKLEDDKFWYSNFTSCSSAVAKMKTPSTISPMSNTQSHTHQPPLVRIYMHNLHFVKWENVQDVFTK